MATQNLLYVKSNATKCRLMVGRTVMVLWTTQRGKDTFYQGKITKYDIVSDRHTVIYSDNDVKHYDLSRITFRILGEGHTYKPTGEENKNSSGNFSTPYAGDNISTSSSGSTNEAAHDSGAYSSGSGYSGYSMYSGFERKFPGYNPKNKDVITPTTFSCYLDDRCFEDGDSMVLLGTLPQMGGFDQGVLMQRHPSQPHVWQVVVMMPFEPAETCLTGIFEFKFGIRTVNGQILSEGGKKRLAETMSNNFYANYRHTSARRFRSIQRASNAKVATVFLYRAIRNFENGLCTSVEVMNVFEAIYDEFEPTRTTLMAMLNNHIRDTKPDADKTTSDMCIILCTAMIGKLGRTSRERKNYTYSTSYYSYNNSYAAKPKPKDMSVTAWCMRAVEAAFNVQQEWDMQLHQALGSKQRAGWCAEGIKDAVERLRKAKGGFFEWLRIIPIIHRYHTSPTFSFTYNKYEDQFKSWATKCFDLIDNHRDHLAEIPPVPMRKPKRPPRKDVSVTGGGAPAADAGHALAIVSGLDEESDIGVPDDGLLRDANGAVQYTNPLKRWLKKNSLSALWMEFLCHYSPSLSVVCYLVKHMQKHPRSSDGLLSMSLTGAFKWIGDFPWETIAELNGLTAALDKQPLLRSPSIITQILTNKKSDAVCDKPGGLDKVLNLLQFCLAVHVPLAKHPDLPTRAEEEAYFGNAIRATKEWFHRRHGDDDDDDDDDNSGFKSGGTTGYSWTSNFGYSYKKKRKTPAERKAARLARLNIALKELDFLFRHVPCFATNPQNMIYELNRCPFMSAGDRKDTIELLALVAAQHKDMSGDQMSTVLGLMLQQKASTLVDDYFKSGSSSAARAEAIVKTICHAIPRTSGGALFAPVVLHSFISNLVSGVTKDNSVPLGYLIPSELLSHFLSHSSALSLVFGWAIGSPSNKAALKGTPLLQLLHTCTAAIQQLAMELNTESVQLSTLHVVVDKVPQTLTIINLAHKYTSGTANVSGYELESLGNRLEEFDRDLKMVQTFLTTFCNCGVPTEISDLQKRIDELTQDYDILEMCAIGGKLGDILEYFPQIPTLYELRTSEIFLGVWRTVGEEMCGWPTPPPEFRERPSHEQKHLLCAIAEPNNAHVAKRVQDATVMGDWVPSSPIWRPKVGSKFPEKLANSLAPAERRWLDLCSAFLQEGAQEWISTGLILIEGDGEESDASAAPPRVQVDIISLPVVQQQIALHVPQLAPITLHWLTAEHDGQILLAAPPVIVAVSFPYNDQLEQGDELVAVNGVSTLGMPVATFCDTLQLQNMELRALPIDNIIHLEFLAHSHKRREEAIAAIKMANVKSDNEKDFTPAAIARRAAENFGLRTYKDDQTAFDVEHIRCLWLPLVLHRWHGLQQALRTSTIEIFGLESTFGALANGQPSRVMCLQELAIILNADATLAIQAGATRAGRSKGLYGASKSSKVKAALPQDVVQRVSDFVLLLQIRRQVPALLGLFNSLVGDSDSSLGEVDNDIFRITCEDETVGLLAQTSVRLNREWSHHTLKSIGSLINPIRPIVEMLSHAQMNFLSELGMNSILMRWLATHRIQEEFNQLLQVCRPCTDEPRLLASIASLVHVRTVLRTVLYVEKEVRYASFKNFLERFAGAVDVDLESLEHAIGLSSTFEALLDVFEKQTKAPGIKSCYDLVEIHTHGLFVISASQNLHDVLCLEYHPHERVKTGQLQKMDADGAGKEVVVSEKTKKEEEKSSIARTQKSETLEYLLDLRSKLMMTEISPETDEETNVIALLAAFAEQLEVLIRIKDQVHSLCCAGHFAFQPGYRYTFPFNLGHEALGALQDQHIKLKSELQKWNKIVEDARDKYFFLNYYTIQEIWGLRKIIMTLTNKSLHGTVRLQAEAKLKLMLHLVTSSSKVVERAQTQLLNEVNADAIANVCAEFCVVEPGKLLYAVGIVLQHIFHNTSSKMYRRVSALDQLVKNSSDMLVSLRSDNAGGVAGKARATDDTSSTSDSGSSSVKVANVHAEHPIWVTTAEKPGLTLDMVLSVYIRRGRLPEPGEIVFCLPSTSAEEVELLLRRYIMARANQREDAIFCLANVHNLPYTTQVAIVKLLKTFVGRYGTENASGLLIVSGLPGQVILSSLSSYQVELPPLELSTLRQKCTEYFSPKADTIGGTSCVRSRINGGGKSHYILAQAVKAQRKAADANRHVRYFRLGYREATNASSLVQQLSTKLALDEIVEREISTETDTLMKSVDITNFFHIDIGHIVPQTANTVLFQLLFVGVLSDQRTGLIYHRDPADSYMIEVSNSPLDKTAEMLRVCRFLPNVLLQVSADTLEFSRPEVTSEDATHVICPHNDKLRHACKTLKALDTGRYRQGEETFQEELDVESHIDVTKQECFSLICKYGGFHDTNTTQNNVGSLEGGAGATADPPSWALVSNFINYIDAQFRGLEGYSIWNFLPMYVQFEGSEGRTMALFRDRFLHLVIATTRDFAMRAVPRGKQYMAAVLDEMGSDAAAVPIVKPPLLRRSSSSNSIREPGLNRQLSGELRRRRAVQAVDDELVGNHVREGAARFERMANWEDTDHPVAVLYPEIRNPHETGGLDVFALNRTFTSRFIDRQMADSLADMSSQGIKLDKDWSKMTNAEGRRIIAALAGVIPDLVGQEWQADTEAAQRYILQVSACEAEKVEEPSAGYVLTVDNLLKMLSIFSRLRTGLPVIIMGETGCGKSSLIRQMCALAKCPLHTLNIHGGMDDAQILTWMREQVIFANGLIPSRRLIVFLDEVNTCNSMALFKEITCDHTLEGVPLPLNLQVIAACNPYRLRKHTVDSDKHLGTGLVYGKQAVSGDGQHQLDNIEEVSGITDPLEELVYRVHPLPESMVDHVFDFGSLTAETEQLYINSIIKTQLKLYVSEEEEQKQIQELAAQAKQLSMLEQLGPEQREPIQQFIGQLSAEGLSREGAKNVKSKLVDQLAAAAVQYEGSEIGLQLHAMIAQFQKEDKEVDTEKEQQKEKNIQTTFGGYRYGGYGGYGGYGANTGTRVGAYSGGYGGYGGYSYSNSNSFNWGGGTWGGSMSYSNYFRRKTFTDYQEFVVVYSDLICAAQEFVRSVNSGERSSASLRDVARCVKIFRWFGEHFARVYGAKEKWTLKDFFGIKPVAHARIRQAVFMSIAYCYHARLGRELREGLRRQLEETWKELQKPTGHFWGQSEYGERCQWLRLSDKSFKDVVQGVERDFVSNMSVPAGIAMNEALCENLFMILVSVLNRIPIFVVGKPGSSKSLAMGLIQSNLNGENSDNAFLQALPSVEVFSYQCSPLSTSQGIEQVFEAANRYKAEAQDTVVVVLLDEVGLAEQSPHLPLKVLHKLLDEADGGQAVVGISNWALDPAKMNRAVHLYRPAPTPADLAVTARGIVQGASLKGYLDSLANAYHEVYLGQTQADFWGLREFYSLVKKINRDIQQLRFSGEAADLQPQQFLHSIQRNFGGRPREMERVIEIFFQKVGMLQQLPRLQYMPVLDLIVENLKSLQARHLMILTKNNVALSLLYDYHLVDHDNSEVIFGSDFPLDQSDLQICLNIQRIKNCMAQGRTVVLIHCEGLYESLYDLLNQHYTEYSGQLYVRLAFGTSSRLCPLVKEFRVVVVVDQVEAYTQLPPPLLNRFEKQVLARQHLLTDVQRDMVMRLQAFVLSFVKCEFIAKAHAPMEADIDPITGREIERTNEDDIAIRIREAFCGYHGGMLLSLAQSMDLEEKESLQRDKNSSCTVTSAVTNSPEAVGELESIQANLECKLPLQRAVERLLWCATPEAASKWMSPNDNVRLAMRRIEAEFGVNILHTYFKNQRHSNLPTFVRSVFCGDTATPSAETNNTCGDQNIHKVPAPSIDAALTQVTGRDALGSQAVILTFAPFHHATASLLNDACPGVIATELTLHQLSSERDLQQHVGDFFEMDVENHDANDNIIETAPDGHAICKRKDRLLVLHCDPIATSVQRIEHAKYIIENIRASVSHPGVGGSKKHICLLVHLPRGQARQSILVDFNKRWQYAFVDAIDSSESNGMPDVQHLLEMDPALDKILPALDLEKVFVRVFRNALANLIYPYQRFNRDVTNQIGTLLGLVAAGNDQQGLTGTESSSGQNESRFLKLIRDVMGDIMRREKMSINMSMSASSNRDLLVRGTFQNCLHHQILAGARRSLTLIIAHAERNSSLSLIDKNSLSKLIDIDDATQLQNLWFQLYRASLQDEIAAWEACQRAGGPSLLPAENSMSSTTGVRVTVKADGKDKMRFCSRFPFSFYVAKRVESQRGAYMQRISENTCVLEQGLRVQMKAFRLNLRRMAGVEEKSADDALPQKLLNRYLYDFAAMYVLDNAHRNVLMGVAVPVLQRMLMRATGKACTHPSDFHLRFWKHEERINQWLLLLNTLPPTNQTHLMTGLVGDVDGVVTVKTTGLDAAYDLFFVTLALQELEVMVQNTQAGLWNQTLLGMDEHVVHMLDEVMADESKALEDTEDTESNLRLLALQLCEKWEKLSLFGVFLRDIGIPLGLSPEAREKFWNVLSSARLRSHMLLQQQFAFFSHIDQHVTDDIKKSSITNLSLAFSRFIDVYISDYVFSSPIQSQTGLAQANIDTDLLQDIVGLLSQVSMTFNNNSSQTSAESGTSTSIVKVSVPESSRVSLMRMMLNIQFPSTKLKVERFLLAGFKASVKSSILDSPLCVCYTYVREASITDTLMNHGIISLEPTLELAELFTKKFAPHLLQLVQGETASGENIQQILEAVAMARALYNILAKILCSDDTLGDGGEGEEFARKAAQYAAADATSAEDANSAAIEIHRKVDDETRAANKKLTYLRKKQENGDSSDETISAIQQAEKTVRVAIAKLEGIKHGVLAARERAKMTRESANAAARVYASLISDSNAKHCRNLHAKLLMLLGDLLNSGKSHGYLKSLMIYLLKGVERRRGLSYLRSVLARKEIAEAPWCMCWKESAVAFMQFAVANALPTSMPMHHHAGVDAIAQGLHAFLDSEGETDVNLVAAPAADMLQSSKDTAAQLPSAMLIVFFQSCYCLRTQSKLPERIKDRMAVLHDWIVATAVTQLHLPSLVSRMLQRFTDFGSATARDAFYMGIESSTEDILKVRILVHLTAAATIPLSASVASTNPILGFFSTLIFSPKRLASSYLPQMPEDELAYVMKVLGGRWYRCQNGHAYYVDLCGRPTQINKCATCGCDIGGLSHNLLDTNKDVDASLSDNTSYNQKSAVHDDSKPHYFLPAIDNRDNTNGVDGATSVRGIPPSSCRTQRLLLHAALVVGASFGDKAWRMCVRTFSSSVISDDSQLNAHFFDHFRGDWIKLKTCLRKSGDDTELLVHKAICALADEARDGSRSRIFDFFVLPSRELRWAWEKDFSESILDGLLGPDAVDNSLTQLKKVFNHDDNDQKVSLILQEKPLWSFSKSDRINKAPALFRFRPAFSVDDFVSRIGDKYKLLKMFMTEQEQLRSLRNLGDVLRWERLLTVHFNRRISSSDAAALTVARVLDTVGRDQLQWHRAWQGFQTAWASAWQFVAKYTCTELPDMYKQVAMGPNATINLCLPAEEDAGICATALTTYLTTKHNEVVEHTKNHLKARMHGLQFIAGQHEEEQISSQMFSHIHSVSFSMEKFMDFVQRHCLIYSQETGQLEYDFDAAERWLVDVEFATCPSVRLEMDRIQYLDEELSSNARMVLRQSVAQVELSPDVITALTAEFQNPTVAHSCIESLDLMLVFMQEVLRGGMGAQLGNVNLRDHMKAVLVTQEELFKSQTLCSEVKVKHIDALYNFLWAQVSTDDFAQVKNIYKIKLDNGFIDQHGNSHEPVKPRVLDELRALAPRLQLKKLVSFMGNFLSTELSLSMSTGYKIRDALIPFQDDDDVDSMLPETFEEYFPEQIKMGHFVEIFKFLDNLSALDVVE